MSNGLILHCGAADAAAHMFGKRGNIRAADSNKGTDVSRTAARRWRISSVFFPPENCSGPRGGYGSPGISSPGRAGFHEEASVSPPAGQPSTPERKFTRHVQHTHILCLHVDSAPSGQAPPAHGRARLGL